MNQFEFIAYRPTPNDTYGMLGIATVRIYGKVILRFKHVKTKDGTGSFFCAANYTYEEHGEKKYTPSFMLDSRSEDEMLLEFVRLNVKSQADQMSAHATNRMKEVNDNAPLPF